MAAFIPFGLSVQYQVTSSLFRVEVEQFLSSTQKILEVNLCERCSAFFSSQFCLWWLSDLESSISSHPLKGRNHHSFRELISPKKRLELFCVSAPLFWEWVFTKYSQPCKGARTYTSLHQKYRWPSLILSSLACLILGTLVNFNAHRKILTKQTFFRMCITRLFGSKTLGC